MFLIYRVTKRSGKTKEDVEGETKEEQKETKTPGKRKLLVEVEMDGEYETCSLCLSCHVFNLPFWNLGLLDLVLSN